MDDKRYNRCLALREMMKSPLWEEAIQAVKDGVSREIVDSKPMDREGRESLYHMALALDVLIGRLNEIAAEATVIETKVEKAKLHAAE